jgi:hypothetical protein
MTATAAPPTPPIGAPSGSKIWRILITLIIVVIAAMWVYYFFFASAKATYRVDDAAWRERAQSICERYEAERLKLVDTAEGYIAEPTNDQMLERADIVDQATDLLEAELAEVLAVQPASERDRSLLTDYEKYWRILIADRRAYTAQLRTFDLQPYYETLVDGGPVSNTIVDFTTVNEITACRPPGELGGDV